VTDYHLNITLALLRQTAVPFTDPLPAKRKSPFIFSLKIGSLSRVQRKASKILLSSSLYEYSFLPASILYSVTSSEEPFSCPSPAVPAASIASADSSVPEGASDSAASLVPVD
jgi:hypothetical protein